MVLSLYGNRYIETTGKKIFRDFFTGIIPSEKIKKKTVEHIIFF